jgi:hypothetical protein
MRFNCLFGFLKGGAHYSEGWLKASVANGALVDL